MSDLLRMLMAQPSPSIVPEGMVEAGNVRIDNRPSVPNPEGGESTVLSMGIGEGDPTNPVEVVIPRVVGGEILSPDDAIQHYMRTGEHLGKFGRQEPTPGPLTPPQRTQASEYGRILHEDQEGFRFGGGYVTPSATPSLASILSRAFAGY